MKILVTGGAGYIGSHACVQFLAAGHEVVVLDNLSNAKATSLDRVRLITNRDLKFIEGDIRAAELLDRLLAAEKFDAVIHFAGLKAVGESTEKPLLYYQNNVAGSATLFEAMTKAGVKTMVFSSSATVYGDPAAVPITEDFPTAAVNPYGRSKLMIEDMLRDIHAADPAWRIAILRYFNPVGAHESGRIGEDPNGVPNNLLPYVCQVAVGKRAELKIFGGDYPTRDGTGVRDYIHVMDLVQGHVAALDYLMQNDGLVTLNLGTGRGYSVREVVTAFERASGRRIPYQIVARRPGDVAECYADPTRAYRLLGWRAARDLDVMCADAWNWQRQNPDGYGEA